MAATWAPWMRQEMPASQLRASQKLSTDFKTSPFMAPRLHKQTSQGLLEALPVSLFCPVFWSALDEDMQSRHRTDRGLAPKQGGEFLTPRLRGQGDQVTCWVQGVNSIFKKPYPSQCLSEYVSVRRSLTQSGICWAPTLCLSCSRHCEYSSEQDRMKCLSSQSCLWHG